MKKIFLLQICCFSLALVSNAQDSTGRNNWFVSLSTGFCLGGPGSGIVGAFNDQGFDQSSNDWFGTASYPINTPKARLLFMAGKRITKSGSLYLVLGQPVGGVVQGYNGSSVVSYDYSVFQYTLGYQFSFPNTTFRLGVGPSLFTFKNTPQNEYKDASTESSTVAGGTITFRAPFGKEKKIFGVEFFGQINLAPSVPLAKMPGTGWTFQAGKVSMTYAVIGITFAFRG